MVYTNAPTQAPSSRNSPPMTAAASTKIDTLSETESADIRV